MDLIADRGRRVTVDELNTTRLLAHARQQAVRRKLDDVLIVDVDAHHYENEHMGDILPYMENPVLRQVTMGGLAAAPRRGGIFPSNAGSTQDMGGRVTRYPMRGSEKTEPGRHRDIQLGERWMDAMSVDYSCLFPTLMLAVGLHPEVDMEVEFPRPTEDLGRIAAGASPSTNSTPRGSWPMRGNRRCSASSTTC